MFSYLRVAAKRFGDTVPNLVVSGWYEQPIGSRVGSEWRDSITDEKLERVLNDSDVRAKRLRRDQVLLILVFYSIYILID